MAMQLASVQETQSFAARLGAACTGGEVLLLRGELGSGKTCFVQGLARGLGVSPEQPVTSCTFVLHAQYRGRLLLNHLDLYRLGGADTGAALCLEELWGDPTAVAAVEWADLLGEETPDQYLLLTFTIEGETLRTLDWHAKGHRHATLAAHLDQVTAGRVPET